MTAFAQSNSSHSRPHSWIAAFSQRATLANLVSFAVVLLMAAAYIVQINGSVGKGYQMRDLETRIHDLTISNQKLEVASREAQALDNVSKAVKMIGMVPAETPKYVRSAAPSVAFGIDTPMRVNLDYFYLGQDNLPDYGIPWVPNTNNALRSDRDYPAPSDWHNFYGLVNRDYEHTATHLVTGKIEHDFNDDFTLRNVLRYGHSGRDSVVTSPRFLSDNNTLVRRTDWKSRDQIDTILDEQIELTSKFETLGFPYLREVCFFQTG